LRRKNALLREQISIYVQVIDELETERNRAMTHSNNRAVLAPDLAVAGPNAATRLR
jgi:hypothetical protein